MFCVSLSIVEGIRLRTTFLSLYLQYQLQYFCKKYYEQASSIYERNLFRSIVLFIHIIREVRGVKRKFLPRKLPAVLLVHGLLGSLPFLCSALSAIMTCGGSQAEGENSLDLRKIFLFISESEFYPSSISMLLMFFI